MAEKHFVEQKRHAENYLIPYFRKHCPGFDRFRILEIGCAEGGFLDALQDYQNERLRRKSAKSGQTAGNRDLSRSNGTRPDAGGIQAVGLELSPGRVNLAKSINPNLNILVGDITDPKSVWSLDKRFDLIVMRDVIEHIPDKKAAWVNIIRLLKADGFFYITFPPRFSPFGGHHQNGKSVLRLVPYFHLLPNFIIRISGKIFGEHLHIVDNAIMNYKDGLSIFDFEKYCAEFSFRFVQKELFFLRPVYQTRFGTKPRRMADVPFLREVIAFGCETLLQAKRPK